MITVHHLGVSQSERAIWVCEELGLDYKLVRYDRDPQTRLAPESYRKLHPMGIAPVIEDGDMVLGESGAIVEYILTKYGNGKFMVGPDDSNFADYLYWFHFANATLMPAQMVPLIVQMLGIEDVSVLEALTDRTRNAFDLMEARLTDTDYFAGPEFTAADIMMFFPLTTMRAFTQQTLADKPNIAAYLKRVGARPAYQQAMKKGDPDMPPVLG